MAANAFDPKLIAIGEHIRQHRKRQKLSQEELAFLAGMAPSQISDIENGKTDAGITRYLRIADALRISLAAIQPEAIEEELAEAHEVLGTLNEEKRRQYLTVIRMNTALVKD